MESVVELPPFSLDDRKANIANFWLHNEFSATAINLIVSGKWKLATKTILCLSFNKNIYFVGRCNRNNKSRCAKFTLKIVVHKFYPIWLYASSIATLWKKWIETIKYWNSWWYPFCTPLKFNKSHLIYL